MEDRELVQKLIAKDSEAERYFFLTHRDRLAKACYYVLGYQDPEAEDVAQEAFVAAFRGIGQFEFRSSLSHWLIRIGMNLCYERIRKRQKQIVRAQEELEGLAGAHSIKQERHKEEDAEKDKLLQLIETQRDVLGDPCRNLLRLRDEESKSYAAISAVLKVPMGTVMSRLARCKEALKQLVLNALKEGTRA